MLKRFLIRQPGANQRLRGAWARRSRVVREDDDLGTGAGIGGGGWEGALKVVGGVMAAGSALAGYGKKAVNGQGHAWRQEPQQVEGQEHGLSVYAWEFESTKKVMGR